MVGGACRWAVAAGSAWYECRRNAAQCPRPALVCSIQRRRQDLEPAHRLAFRRRQPIPFARNLCEDPAAFARTGKLYWFGNISRGPTQGNSPGYPLYLAEVDETRPAIERATLTLIDDYDPRRDTPAVQFSNFFVFENRQTHAFDLYLSPYGQYPNVYQASVYKYVIAIK